MQPTQQAIAEAEHSHRRPVPLWRNTNFVLLWSGQAVSSIGTQLSQLAYPLLVLALTHSPAQAGFIGAARAVPYLILCLPAGALIDRWDRKRAMILCDAGRAVALGSIPVAYVLGTFRFRSSMSSRWSKARSSSSSIWRILRRSRAWCRKSSSLRRRRATKP